jgi:hypothetical protein
MQSEARIDQRAHLAVCAFDCQSAGITDPSGDFFHAGFELYNPPARRAAPPGSAVEPPWPRGQESAPLLKYVKDLTPSDTLVNCTYLVCTLWDTFFTVTNIL